MPIGGGAAGACGAAVVRKGDVRGDATAPPAATPSPAIIGSSLVVRGRVNIVPTQGIVEVVEVVGHGTGVTGTLAVPPRLCAASVAEPPSRPPRLAAPGELLAVAVVGLPRLDDADEAVEEEFALV